MASLDNFAVCWNISKEDIGPLNGWGPNTPTRCTPRCTPMRCTPMKCTPTRCTPMRCTPMRCTPMKCIPMRYTPVRCTPMTCTPVKYTPMRHTPITYTPVRYTPMRHPPIRCTLVGCMPVRYVLIFENSFVALDAEPGLAVMSGSAAVTAPRGYDDYQWGVRCIRTATRFEGGDRGQIHWTCGLGSPNRGGGCLLSHIPDSSCRGKADY